MVIIWRRVEKALLDHHDAEVRPEEMLKRSDKGISCLWRTIGFQWLPQRSVLRFLSVLISIHKATGHHLNPSAFLEMVHTPTLTPLSFSVFSPEAAAAVMRLKSGSVPSVSVEKKYPEVIL